MWIEPLPAIVALKRAKDEEMIAQWLATHEVQRVPCIIEDLDVRSIVPEMRPRGANVMQFLRVSVERY